MTIDEVAEQNKRLRNLLCEVMDIKPSVATAWIDHIAANPDGPPEKLPVFDSDEWASRLHRHTDEFLQFVQERKVDGE